MIDFQTEPSRYRHWKLRFDGPIVVLLMDVDENGGLEPGYELKLNSYDLGVDIELYDAAQRLRFEHPEVRAVVLASGNERVFCAGANIRMLAQSDHGFKVNFCKFTNETRLAIEDASAHSSQRWLTAINGSCVGGGYELALATDYILMADDGSTSVSLPELPLLAVLPGTGGLTRLVDKRRVRRDLADVLCTTEEGVRGTRAIEWGLVDELAARSKLMEAAIGRAREFAQRSNRPAGAQGITLAPLKRIVERDRIAYENLTVSIDRNRRMASLTVRGPSAAPPQDARALGAQGAEFWPLKLTRELEDAILHLRLNEETLTSWVFRTEGEPERVAAYDRFLVEHRDDWLARETTLYLKRTLKRLDVTSRSLFSLIEPGSCFVGALFELALACDRSYMLCGTYEDDDRAPATIGLTELNFGALAMGNGLSRLETRFWGAPESLGRARKAALGRFIEAAQALELGLVTFAPDDIDWGDEVRLALEQRAAFSSDALTGLEASLRFAGPETLETKIFARLSCWQNWIFQRPNAVGEKGALRLYGTGRRAEFDGRRV
jgi:benzoyl-CoA-dihydrodiol lyase